VSGQTPRCIDCEYVNEKSISKFPNCSLIASELEEWELESIDHTKFVYDSSVDVDSDESLCFSQIYCNATDTMESGCDDYVINRKRLSRGYILSFIFLSVAGLAPYFTIDMEDTIVEETVLDCILESSATMKWITWLGAQSMYFLLRGRHLILPFFIAQATTAIFLSDTFSVMNMLLNILSIAFLIEIDDLFAVFIIPSNELEEMNTFFTRTLSQHQKNKVSIAIWLWPRSVSIAVIAIMIYVTIDLDSVVSTLNYIGAYQGNNCGDYITASVRVFHYGSVLLMLLHALKAPFCHHIGQHKLFDISMIFVLDLFRSSVALVFKTVVIILCSEMLTVPSLTLHLAPVVVFGIMIIILLITKRTCYE